MGAPPVQGGLGAPPPAPNAVQSSSPEPDDSQLLGGPRGPSADMQQQLEGVTKRFRDLQVEIRSLAKSYPPASKDFDSANESLRSAMMKVTRLLASQQPQSAPV